jgi:hypothetical protein
LPLGFKGLKQYSGTYNIYSAYEEDLFGFPWYYTFNILEHINEIERKREAVIF